jgi:ribosomal-protein-alanine N-acetyltransferase
MKIEDAAKDDLKALCEIENGLFDKNSFALTRQNFLYHIKKNPLFVCWIEDKAAGYILLLTHKKSAKLRIYSLGVKEEFQGKGIGLKLLEKSFAYAEKTGKKSIKLEVNAANYHAIRLYEKAGFVKSGIASNYYPDGADALLLEKSC